MTDVKWKCTGQMREVQAGDEIESETEAERLRLRLSPVGSVGCCDTSTNQCHYVD